MKNIHFMLVIFAWSFSNPSIAESVWVLQGKYIGQDNQVRALGSAFDRGYFLFPLTSIEKDPGKGSKLDRYKWAIHAHLLTHFGVSDLSEVVQWPQFVLGIGGAKETLAAIEVIKEAAGNQVITVNIGDPEHNYPFYDLIAVGEHTPDVDKLPLEAPFMRSQGIPHAVTEERLAAIRADLDPRYTSMAPPVTAVFVGGNIGSRVIFTADHSRRLVAQLGDLFEELGGTVFVSTSRRTPPEAVEALRAALGASTINYHLYEYAPDDESNPYWPMVAVANLVVTTGDSISMMSEIQGTGKPLLVFDPDFGEAHQRRFCRHMIEQNRAGDLLNFQQALSITYEPFNAAAGIVEAARRIAETRWGPSCATGTR